MIVYYHMSKLVTHWTDVMFHQDRECRPDETINSMLRRDQMKPRRSKDRVNVSL